MPDLQGIIWDGRAGYGIGLTLAKVRVCARAHWFGKSQILPPRPTPFAKARHPPVAGFLLPLANSRILVSFAEQDRVATDGFEVEAANFASRGDFGHDECYRHVAFLQRSAVRLPLSQ